MKKHFSQRGGTILGFILGVLVGLAGALVVAVYVSKVPVPFLNKMDPRAANQDATEAQRNKNWDPNAPLYGKSPARAAPVQPSAPGVAAPQDAGDPLGDLARARAKADAAPTPSPPAAAAAAASEPFQYFVQAGAFRTEADADAQRAKLAMLGWEARVSEREQSGRTVFRVRVGPFPKRDDAEGLKDRLDAAGVDATLVRVAREPAR